LCHERRPGQVLVAFIFSSHVGQHSTGSVRVPYVAAGQPQERTHGPLDVQPSRPQVPLACRQALDKLRLGQDVGKSPFHLRPQQRLRLLRAHAQPLAHLRQKARLVRQVQKVVRPKPHFIHLFPNGAQPLPRFVRVVPIHAHKVGIRQHKSHRVHIQAVAHPVGQPGERHLKRCSKSLPSARVFVGQPLRVSNAYIMGQQRRVGRQSLAPVVTRPGEPVVVRHSHRKPVVERPPLAIIQQGIVGLGLGVLHCRGPRLVPSRHYVVIQPGLQRRLGGIVRQHRLPHAPFAGHPLLNLAQRGLGRLGLPLQQIGHRRRLAHARCRQHPVVQGATQFCRIRRRLKEVQLFGRIGFGRCLPGLLPPGLLLRLGLDVLYLLAQRPHPAFYGFFHFGCPVLGANTKRLLNQLLVTGQSRRRQSQVQVARNPVAHHDVSLGNVPPL